MVDIIEEKIKQSKKPVILGDVLYHGPRNPLPLEYNPLEVIKLLHNLYENNSRHY